MSDEQLLFRVAYLYYTRDLTQQQVADRIGVARVKVSRLLTEARQRGIVRIEVQHPLVRLAELEYELRNRYGLVDAVVAAQPPDAREDPQLQLDGVATAAANYLGSLYPEPRRVGVSWGRTMYALAERMEPGWADGVEVVQLNGTVSRSSAPTHADNIAATLAKTGRGVAHLLAAPAIVDRPEIREAFESDRTIVESLELARAVEVAIFSLGALSRDSVLVQSGYLDQKKVEELAHHGCVGDVLSRFVTADGKICDEDLDARTIGLRLTDLTAKRRSIGVAAGLAKVDIARAALTGGLINTLVVDEDLARRLLELPAHR